MSTYKQFLSKLGRTSPVIQAPMANVSTEILALKVYKSGGLGSLALSPINLLHNPNSVFENVAKFRLLTSERAIVNCNFFCFDPKTQPAPTTQERRNWAQLYEGVTGVSLDKILEKVGDFSRAVVSFNEFEDSQPEKFDNFINQLIETKVKVVSFHFGIPSQRTIRKLQTGGIMVWGCVTLVEEAKTLVDLGVDVLVCQGYEAGGHRGNFLVDSHLDENLGTLMLFRQVKQYVDTVSNPPFLVPSGGIVDGVTILNYLKEGAAAVQLGTVFIPTTESSAPRFIAKNIEQENRMPTIMTPLISGRSARTLRTPFIASLIREQAKLKYSLPLFGYSTSAYRKFSSGEEKYGFYLAGQNYHLADTGISATKVMDRLNAEIEAELGELI